MNSRSSSPVENLPLWARIAMPTVLIAVVIGLTSILLSGNNTKSSESQPVAEVPESAPNAPDPNVQVFENDYAKAEFRGIKDSSPYFFLNFMVTNKMDQSIVVSASDVVVNESVNVRANGGTSILEPVESGNSGFAALSVSNEYAGVNSASEVKTVTGTLVLNDESMHEIATLPFSVTIE